VEGVAMTEAPLSEDHSAEIDNLIREIRADREEWGRKSVEYAIRIGERLERLVNIAPWGSKAELLREHVGLSEKTVERYRYLAKHKTILEQIVPNLGEVGLCKAQDLIVAHNKKARSATIAARKKKHRVEADSDDNVVALVTRNEVDPDKEFEDDYDALPESARIEFDRLSHFLKCTDAEAILDFCRMVRFYTDLPKILKTIDEEEEAAAVAAR
jgi:hypothetical protein